MCPGAIAAALGVAVCAITDGATASTSSATVIATTRRLAAFGSGAFARTGGYTRLIPTEGKPENSRHAVHIGKFVFRT